MDLLFLGTSSGTPTRARNVTALALLEDTGKSWYLIDCGEGTQHQMLHTVFNPGKLNKIFITHFFQIRFGNNGNHFTGG